MHCSGTEASVVEDTEAVGGAAQHTSQGEMPVGVPHGFRTTGVARQSQTDHVDRHPTQAY